MRRNFLWVGSILLSATLAFMAGVYLRHERSPEFVTQPSAPDTCRPVKSDFFKPSSNQVLEAEWRLCDQVDSLPLHSIHVTEHDRVVKEFGPADEIAELRVLDL